VKDFDCQIMETFKRARLKGTGWVSTKPAGPAMYSMLNLSQQGDDDLPLRDLIFAKASRALMRVEDRLWEYRFGITTRSPGGFEDREHLGYDTIPYRVIFKILDRLMLRPDDIFLDIGCGRGRVLCCAARFGISQLIGVDDVAKLAESARRNLQSLQLQNLRHEIICAKAQDLDYSHVTSVYMYNPFGASTTREVLNVIRESLVREPHQLRIAYVNPRQESVLAETGWLECYEDWGPERLPGHKRRVSFWRSVGHP
jgi:SAM-dependent methyltransferase